MVKLLIFFMVALLTIETNFCFLLITVLFFKSRSYNCIELEKKLAFDAKLT